MKLKYYIRDLDFLRAYNSPFKPPQPKLYIGKTAIGTPYFLPRVWKMLTIQEAIDKATAELERNPNAKKINLKQIFIDLKTIIKNRLLKFIIIYFIFYSIFGTILFVNFYPFT